MLICLAVRKPIKQENAGPDAGPAYNTYSVILTITGMSFNDNWRELGLRIPLVLRPAAAGRGFSSARAVRARRYRLP